MAGCLLSNVATDMLQVWSASSSCDALALALSILPSQQQSYMHKQNWTAAVAKLACMLLQGLTAVQTATCIVHAAPAAPDLPAIIGALQ